MECFAMTMAIKDPTTGTKRGTVGGRHIARSKPVNAALPSLMVTLLPLAFCMIASKSTAEAVPKIIMNADWSPK